jgi:hypothetical protein
MHRLPRIVLLVASAAASACFVTNPTFDLKGETTGATSITGAQGDTTGTGESSDPAPTTSGGSGTAGLTTAGLTTAGVTTTGLTTTDASTTDVTTTGVTTTGGVGDADSSSGGASLSTTGDGTTTGETTGAPQPMTAELRHYPDEAQCDFPFWCVFNGDISKPSTAENRNVECFDAPLDPPFTVERVGFVVYGSKNSPAAKLEFHSYDDGAKKPVAAPFHVVDIGKIDGNGYRDFPLDSPVFVDAHRFCISVHSGQQFGPQLGLALDDVLAPAGQTFVAINGPQGCQLPALTDITTLQSSKKTQWCIDATISKSP